MPAFEGQGGAAGFAKGNADVILEADGESATKLSYTAHAQIGGKLAQIGSRLVDGAARKIASEFFKRFSAHTTSEAADAAQHEEAQTDLKAAEGASATDTPAVMPPTHEDSTQPNAQATADKGKKSWKAWISKS